MTPLNRFKVLSIIYSLVFLFAISTTGMAQRRVKKNLKPIAAANADTLLTRKDSTGVAGKDTARSQRAQLEAPVFYEANDSIVFTSNGYANLYGSGKMTYQKIELTADVISMNMDSTSVYAHGEKDSIGTVKGTPVFKDGDTSYETNSIRYNFNSRRGLISNIISQQGEGYVTGNNAKKGANDELFLRDGRYTTCDLHEHPHFYMQMTYAKVRPKKNCVMGPAYLVVEDVPLPIAVPFFFFPFSSKYSSGFLLPTYMDDSTRGFGLTNGGYYFAINDNMDLKITGDIFTKGSWALNAQTNYVKRYRYSGLLEASYQVTKVGDKGVDQTVSKDFKLVWSHRQDPKANPNTSFNASVNFSTSSYERTNIGNLYNTVGAMSQNTKTSSVSYSRRLFDQRMNISASANIAQTMRDSSIAVTLPDMDISWNTFFPFKRKHPVGDERWYEKISMRYTGRIRNSIRTKDDKLFKSNLVKDWVNGVQHDIPISATFTLFKYFNLTPSFNYTERWYFRKVKKDWNKDTQEVTKDTIYGFNRVYNYSASLGLNTKIYAMYRPLLFPKKAIQIRQIITPSVSLSAAPDFSSSHYGYYGSYVMTDRYGHESVQSYSYYEGQPFGFPSGGKQGNINMSLSTNVEMKYKDKNDSIKKVSIIDELGGSLSYNMAAKVRPWSNLNLNVRLKLTKNYTFSMGATFATYAYAFNKQGQVVESDRTEWSYGRFGRFQGYGTSFSYSLNNQTWDKIMKFFSKTKKKKGDTDNKEGENGDDTASDKEDNEDMGMSGSSKKEKQQPKVSEDGYQAFNMPWNINLSTGFNISEDTNKPINKHTMRYPYKVTINALNISGSVKLTNNWSVSFNSGYDFDMKKVVQTSFNITRNLHCFTMTASLSPFGVWKYYNFSIRANANILQDLKWEQRSQTQSNVRWY